MIRKMLLFVMLVPLLQVGSTPVVGPPSITYETLLRVLQQRPTSPLIPHAQIIWDESRQAGIDVGFALAIWLKESEFGTMGASVTTRNPGNLSCAAADPAIRSGCSGRWAIYSSWPDAVADWFAYINRRYAAQGLTTVDAILPVYAPPNENNTVQYINKVITWMRDWGEGIVGTGPAGETIQERIMDDWLQGPIDELKYWLLRGLASLLWTDNQAVLALSVMLAQFRTVLVTQGFLPAIELVAQGMLGISAPVFTLGLTLFCLLLILLPSGRLLHWVSARKLLALMLIVPLLFGVGVAGSLFQQLEQIRTEIATIIYTGMFQSGETNFADIGQPLNTTGTTINTCPLTPFFEVEPNVLHADAIAASYLCVDYEDVMDPDAAPPNDLPDAFADQFFFLDSTAFGAADPAQRASQLSAAAAGVGRMAYGHLLVGLAMSERLTDLLWTLGLGTLFLSLVLVLIFSWFRPYEHLTMILLFRIMQVFSTSWIVSAIFGLVMAVLMEVAAKMYAPLVLGASIGVLLLSLVFLWIAGKTVFGALSASWDALTVGNAATAAGSGRWAGRMMVQGALATAGSGAGALGMLRRRESQMVPDQAAGPESMTGGWRVRAANFTDTLVGYNAARSAGNTADYALGYAITQYRPLARIGTLATAMGAMSPDFEQGLYTATRFTRGPGDLLNLQAQRMVRKDGARHRNSRPSSPRGPTP